ncbi:class I SAM-dependent methyltransferase [Rhodocista pekingensis]|uniref:Class I SAM-dependent methyltransferase n=1 Tax=Rhodocista pekingensis TaxID=201185 RepID=A0ABW2KZZ9_9PROT
MPGTDAVIDTPVEAKKAPVVAGRILAALADVRSVLDIGCGDGIVRLHLPAGVRYLGIDADAGLRVPVRADNVIYMKPGESAFDHVPDEPFDAVLLLDVLEHTRDFTGLFVQACARRPRYVVVSLPNEMNGVRRLAFLRGRCPPEQSLAQVGKPDGHRHMWLVDPDVGTEVLLRTAGPLGYRLRQRHDWRLWPRSPVKRLAYRLLCAVASARVWSFHTVLVFEREPSAG